MFEEKYPGVKVTPTYASSGDYKNKSKMVWMQMYLCLQVINR